MNIVVLKGNLVRDPEVKEISFGERTSTVANFTIAVSRYYKKKNGETEQATEFLDCEAWDTGATSVGKVLKQGDPVLLHGSLKKETWETEDGQKRSRVKVRVANFDKLARFTKSENTEDSDTGSEETTAPVAAAAGDGEDIPF